MNDRSAKSRKHTNCFDESLLRSLAGALTSGIPDSSMASESEFLITTQRLSIRMALIEDAELFFRLWTDPKVMKNVGFPEGLYISPDEIRSRIAQSSPTEFDRLLVVGLKETGEEIGECQLHRPNTDGIASTDVKLLPEYWGHRFGVEIKRALLDYLFTHTDCQAVEATPNVENMASIRMQEAVGGMRVGEQIYTFPAAMQSYTVPVHHYIYRVSRSDWSKKHEQHL